MVPQEKPLEKADFIVRITGPVMVRPLLQPASSDKWKAPLIVFYSLGNNKPEQMNKR